MKTIILCLVLLGLAFVDAKVNPLSDEFIDLINSQHSTWTAGRNFPENTPMEHIHGLMGVLPKTNKQPYPVHPVHPVHPTDDVDIPDTFDARENWPECASVIGEIKDQGACGSCWAVATAGTMSDRICIHSKGSRKVSVSAQDLMTCCDTFCTENGCLGGNPILAWEAWRFRGIATGGGYQSNNGCKSYSIPPCEHHNTNGTKPPCGDIQDASTCTETCDDGSEIENAVTRGWPYYLTGFVEEIQLEILRNGPVQASLHVYEDFLSYKSGVYQHIEGKITGVHAVKILGWGVENETPYWLIANSWNSDWGDNGYFKILRGQDHCWIETQVNAGIPRL